MANITRIKNNQITDSTITYSKIAPGTLVGSVFNPNLTLNSNVTILGNLTISGTPTTIQSTSTYINDPLIVFNNGYVGTPSFDIGIVANRNLQSMGPYGSVNVAWIWEENAQQWQAIATTETGSTAGVINNSGWANVRVGNLTAVSGNITGALQVGSTTNLVGATTFSTATGAGLQVLAIGNVTPGTGAFTTLSATGAATLNTVTGASFQGVIGNVTPASGAFTTLTASGATTVTNSTASTSTSTGALVVTGGVGIGGALYAATAYDNGNRVLTGLTSTGTGNLTIGGTAPSLTVALPSSGPGAVQWGGTTQLPVITTDAYGRVSAASNIALNTITVTNLGNTTEITSNASVGLVGLSLTATGVTAGNYGSATSIPTIVVDSKGRITSITTNAISSGFTLSGTSGSATVNNGSTLTLAGTYGVTVSVGSTYANIATPQDLRTTANPTFNNLTTASVQGVIGNVTPATATFTTVTTGGLQAVAIGNVTPGTGAFTTLTATNGTTLNTVTAASLQASAIGNVTPGTGAFTTLTAQTETVGGLQAVAIGNVTPGTGNFTTVTSANFASGNAQITGGSATGLTNVNSTTGTIQNFASGNAQITGGSATGLSGGTGSTSAGTTQTVRVTSGGVGVTGDSYFANSVGIGQNVTVAGTLGVTGATTLTTATTGGLQAVAIGNVTPGTGAFTTLSASTWANIAATTESTNSTTGALLVAGGVGIAKNLNVGGSVVVTGNLTVNGTVTAVNSTTLDVTDINITVAKGAATAAAANGAGITVDGPAGATITYANADDSWNINKLLNATKETLSDATDATSTTTGALVVAGGVGISKQLRVGGGIQATAIGNATPSTGAFTTLTAQTETVGGLQAVAIGNVTPGTGAFTTLSASGATTLNTVTGASFQGVIGNVTPAAGTFTSVTAGSLSVAALNGTVIGNVTPAAGTFTTLVAQTETVGGLQAVAIGNVTPGTGAFTTLSASGTTTLGLTSATAINNTPIGNATPSTGAFTTLSASGASALNTVTGASFQGVIGNVTPAAGTFTNLAASTLSVPAINGTVIGNVTPAAGTFTTATVNGTLTAQTVNAATVGNTGTTLVGTLSTAAQPNVTSVGNLTSLSVAGTTNQYGVTNIANTASSTNSTTGALIVAGGVGVGGNINAGTFGTSVHSLLGNVLIGRGPSTALANNNLLTLNENTDVPISNPGFVLHVSGKTGSNSAIGVDTFGVGYVSAFYGRHARGTSGTPTAVQTDDTLGGLFFKGYGSTGYSGPSYLPAGISFVAKENYTDTAQGTAISFATVPTGANSAVTVAYLGTDGNLVLKSDNPSTSTTTGALVVAGGAGIAGNVNIGNRLAVAGFITGSGIQVTGEISTLSTTDTVSPGTGSFITPGGASIGGNVYVGKNMYVGPAAFNTSLTTPTVIAVDNGTSYAQMALVNQASSGSADFVAYPSDYQGTNFDHGWADIGFTGNAFSDPAYTITKPHDAYVFGSGVSSSGGGNLVLATDYTGSYNDIVVGVGSFYANSEVARFHGNTLNNGTFVLKLPTQNTLTANTGALQVWGGASFGGNVYHNSAAVFNGGKTAGQDFIVRGKADDTLIWARPGSSYDQVVIGGNATVSSLTSGAKLAINSTDSVIIPVGTSGQRPSAQGYSDVTGMFRYNTTVGAIEWYTGSGWASASTTFTLITDEQFNGDGVTTDFALGGSTTTAATIVSINGVIQIPTLAYTITGVGNSTLSFSEAPLSGDVIDVRRLTTTQTLFGIASPNGKMAFQTDNYGAYIYAANTGASSTVYGWDVDGIEFTSRANVTVASANTPTTVLTFNNTVYRSGKLVIQASSGAEYQVSEALVVQNGTTATITNYGIVQTGGNIGIVTATVSGTTTQVQFTSAYANTVVRTKAEMLLI